VNNPSRQSPAGEWPSGGLERVTRCPVCGDERRAVLYRGLQDRVFFCAPGEWTLCKCGTCGSCYLDPRPNEETISLAYSTYFTHEASKRPAVEAMGALRRLQRSFANGYRNWRYGTHDEPSTRFGILAAFLLLRQRALMDSELRYLPRSSEGRRALDIGCGEGGFLEWATAAGWEALGIDPDPGAVESARRRGLDVRCGGVNVLSGEQASFDVVTLNHVIEHVHDPGLLLYRVRELLKPGGMLWIDTPNVDSTGHRLFGPSWIGLDPPRHLVLFRPSSLRRILNSAGLNVVRTISRFEVSERVFSASHRIALGQDPIGDHVAPWAICVRARLAGWRALIRPDTSEFITIVATREK
jgi:2-polyprenyl-3-methyl-5-hydroxy-6-metoxy-1,4-benzoquinol methylase